MSFHTFLWSEILFPLNSSILMFCCSFIAPPVFSENLSSFSEYVKLASGSRAVFCPACLCGRCLGLVSCDGAVAPVPLKPCREGGTARGVRAPPPHCRAVLASVPQALHFPGSPPPPLLVLSYKPAPGLSKPPVTLAPSQFGARQAPSFSAPTTHISSRSPAAAPPPGDITGGRGSGSGTSRCPCLGFSRLRGPEAACMWVRGCLTLGVRGLCLWASGLSAPPAFA